MFQPPVYNSRESGVPLRTLSDNFATGFGRRLKISRICLTNLQKRENYKRHTAWTYTQNPVVKQKIETRQSTADNKDFLIARRVFELLARIMAAKQ